MREIKGPEDVQALLDGEIFATLSPAWQRVFGESIALAMDAAELAESADRVNMDMDEYEIARKAVESWRELSERLKGM